MSSPKCCCAELIEGGGVAGGIIVVAVALGPHPQVVPVHRVQANNPEQAKHFQFLFSLFCQYVVFSKFKRFSLEKLTVASYGCLEPSCFFVSQVRIERVFLFWSKDRRIFD
jgi:hypothetical protein